MRVAVSYIAATNLQMRTMLLVLALLLVAVQTTNNAQAHFTLGRMTESPRFHVDDFDPHVPGLTAYVWPGSGLAAIKGIPNGLPPGYQTPYPDGNPRNAPSSWYQLEANSYAPFGAVLASTPDHPTLGDLIFGFNFTRPNEIPGLPSVVRYSGVFVYVAPEFGSINRSRVATTMTNSYRDISVEVTSFDDPFGPGWTRIGVATSTVGELMEFSAAHDGNRDGIPYDEFYYIRVNGVVAPYIAGRYFFKVIVRQTPQASWLYPPDFGPPSPSALFVPVQNWPVLLVKAEVDPAIITGTIRFGSWNTTLYDQPITLPGRVRAIGFASNPYTGEVTSRQVEARAYFNATAQGHYEIEGLAAGTYDVYASAAGYPEQLIASDVSVARGQSFHQDGYLNPGPVISGLIFSKHNFGEEPWGDLRPIRVEIYDSYNYNEDSLVAYSPINWTSATWGRWFPGNGTRMSHDWQLGTTPNPKRVGLDWDSTFAYYLNGMMFGSSGPNCGGAIDACGIPQGVGPAQFWWVDAEGLYTNGGGPDGFRFQFGQKGVYGAPTELNGHVPQALATWIDGLHPGRFWMRAFVTGYVQTELDGRLFAERYFDVADKEWAGDILTVLDLRRSSSIEKTVWLHDLENTLLPSVLKRPNTLLVELYDGDFTLVAMNFTFLPAGATNGTVILNGFGMHGWLSTRKFSLFGYRGFGYQDYGIPAGSYQLRVYLQGFIDDEAEEVSVTLSGSSAIVSNHVYRGAAFNVTIFSKDWERPSVHRNWAWPGERFFLRVINSEGITIDTQPSLIAFVQPVAASIIGPLSFDGNYGFIGAPGAEFLAMIGVRPIAYGTGLYTFRMYTYGYVQKQIPSIYVREGATADVQISMIVGANITLHVNFQRESIFDPVPYNMSMRIRVFDEFGGLVASWITGSRNDVLNSNALEWGVQFDPSDPDFVFSLTAKQRLPDRAWYVPAGTTRMLVVFAGIPGGYSDPVFSEVDPGGIDAFPNYSGGWTIEVDTSNWYMPTVFYPPAPSILTGESYHLVVGNTPGPFLWTGDRLEANHLGPYEQTAEWLVPSVHLGGDVSVQYSLHLRGYVSGVVYGFTWSDEFRTMSWVRVSALQDPFEFTVYTHDGFYDMYLPAGLYDLNVEEWSTLNEGHVSVQSFALSVSEGQMVAGMNFYLTQSGIPIPETSIHFRITLACAIGLSRIALQGRRYLWTSRTKERRLSQPQ